MASMSQNFRVSVHTRGMLVSEIYDKTLQIDLSRLSDFANATLMSTDVQRFSSALTLPNILWSSMVRVGIAIWLLEKQVGIICLVPIGVSIRSYLRSTSAIVY